MTVEINLIYLAVIVLVIIAGILAVYIVKSLLKFNRTLDKINSLIDSNEDNINKSIKLFPEICDNVNSITKSLKDKTDFVDQYISGKEESSASIDIESLMSNISTLLELFSGIKDYFSKHNKNKRYLKRKI